MRAADGPPTDVIDNPDQLHDVPVYDLLRAAARGTIGIDHRFLHAILDRPREQVIPDLVRFGNDDHAGDAVSLESDLISLFRHLKAPEALDFFIEGIRIDPEDVPDELVLGLIDIGPPALEALLKLHDELPEEAARETAFVLAVLGVRDERVLRIITDLLEFDATEALVLFQVYNDPAARPTLEQFRAEVQDDPELLRLTDIALAALGDPQPRETEPFDIWNEYPETSGPLFEALSEDDILDVLHGPVAAYRAEAIAVLRNRDLSPKLQKALLHLAKEDPEPAVRGRAWEVLGLNRREDDLQLGRRIRTQALDPNVAAAERAGALIGCCFELDDPGLQKALKQLYEQEAVRARILEAMWRSLDRRYASYMEKHFTDPDPEIKRAAIWGVGYLNVSRLARKLEDLFEDEDYRADALFAYALAAPGETSRTRVHTLLKRIEDLAGGLGEDEASLVETALDERLAMHGFEPVFADQGDDDLDEELFEPPPAPKVGRNDPCPCGSGKKFKKCCGQ